MSEDRIPDEDWATIVSNVPIVSVDLIIRTDDGVVLGRRQNEPAKGEWFVPGGRVKKNETLRKAVHRVAREELGIEVEIIESLGVYEHIYNASDVKDAGGKHYLANGFVVRSPQENFTLNDQHAEIRIFDPMNVPDMHPYVYGFLKDAGFYSFD
ncbi:GDP-mannose mannosyl hydrolase [Halodesulfurarchaeum formicicum]|uniref:GDP-mannose mannosyl hydrolase n=1 Tax=Halodesulfurarchaeum formicicum TaxID=1873524 RepID=A0A1D8S3W2_9EURY|nr:NUDIX domain-containing protein [Halodesulfurarchaeum formicicum]AOW80033.1 GDP-mannose mannosyl hydrolase [Halodesulfurarchaeum formicicum]